MSLARSKRLSTILTDRFSSLCIPSKWRSESLQDIPTIKRAQGDDATCSETPILAPAPNIPSSSQRSINSALINSLPMELLYIIFLIYLDDGGPFKKANMTDSINYADALHATEYVHSSWIIHEHYQRIFTLASVCCRWQNIVNGIPHLWTTLTISYEEIEHFGLTVEQACKRWALFAERAGSLPLDVTWTASSTRWSHSFTQSKSVLKAPKLREKEKKRNDKKGRAMVETITVRQKKEWMKKDGATDLSLLAQVKYHKARAQFIKNVPFSRWGTFRLLDVGVEYIPRSLVIDEGGSGFDNLTIFETRVDRKEFLPLIRLVRATARQLHTLRLTGDWDSAITTRPASSSSNNATGTTTTTTITTTTTTRMKLKSMFTTRPNSDQTPKTSIASEIAGILVLPKLRALKCHNLPKTLESKFPRTVTHLEVEVLTRLSWNFSCIEYLHIHRFILATAFKSRFDKVEVLKIGDKNATGYFDYPTMGDKRVKLRSLRTVILHGNDADILAYFDAPRLTTFRFLSPLVFPERLLLNASIAAMTNDHFITPNVPLTEDQIKNEAWVCDDRSEMIKVVENSSAVNLFATLLALPRLIHPNSSNSAGDLDGMDDAVDLGNTGDVGDIGDIGGLGDVRHLTVTLDEVYDYDTSWAVSFLLTKIFTLETKPIRSRSDNAGRRPDMNEALDLYNRRFRCCPNLETLNIQLLWPQTDKEAWTKCAEDIMGDRSNMIWSGSGSSGRNRDSKSVNVVWSDGKNIEWRKTESLA